MERVGAELVAEIWRLHDAGESVRATGAATGLGRNVVWRVLKAGRVSAGAGDDLDVLAAWRAGSSPVRAGDEDIEAACQADWRAECDAVIAETGARQWQWDLRGKVAGIRERAGLPAHWWESVPGDRLRAAMEGSGDDDGGDPEPCRSAMA